MEIYKSVLRDEFLRPIEKPCYKTAIKMKIEKVANEKCNMSIFEYINNIALTDGETCADKFTIKLYELLSKDIPSEDKDCINVLIEELKDLEPMMIPQANPEYDSEQNYIPRQYRDEWVKVAKMGHCRVRSDGNCIVNEYCTCADGLAVQMASIDDEELVQMRMRSITGRIGWRVLEILNNDVILIDFQ